MNGPAWKPDLATLQWVLDGIRAAPIIATEQAMPPAMERFTKEELARAAIAITKKALVQSLEDEIARRRN